MNKLGVKHDALCIGLRIALNWLAFVAFLCAVAIPVWLVLLAIGDLPGARVVAGILLVLAAATGALIAAIVVVLGLIELNRADGVPHEHHADTPIESD